MSARGADEAGKRKRPFEGNTSHGRVSLWNVSTWRAGSYVTVWVLFGSANPSHAAIARAQAELDGVQFAGWKFK